MKLVPIESVSPATYNPRSTDPVRLELIKLSLRKLGFLLPIYATVDSEILSGHQRQLAAGQMGVSHIPVVETPPMDLMERKGINLLFNRATNDLVEHESSQSLTVELLDADIEGLAADLPDKQLNEPEFYPCLRAMDRPIGPYLDANAGRWNDYAATVSGKLFRKGICLPIVVDPDGVVVNGIGRLQFCSEKDIALASFVEVTHAEAHFARMMLNRLTMDFDVAGRMQDEVRFNNFRRARQVPARLGTGYAFVAGVNDLTKLADRKRFIEAHGRHILDFGAGLRTEADMLRPHGIDVEVFEPFCNDGSDNVDVELSRRVVREFLEGLLPAREYSSIFLNFVLNSIPFDADRRHVLTLLQALTGPATKVFISTKSVLHGDCRRTKRGNTETTQRVGSFPLNYEPNVNLSELSDRFRTQKFFEPVEFVELLKCFWVDVRLLGHVNGTLRALCTKPLPLTDERLRQAIEFEFDLPYPDGSRMGLVKEALAVIGERTGRKL